MKFNLIARKKDEATVFSASRNMATGFMKPLRDWTIGLGIATTLFIFGISFITYDFFQQFRVSEEEVVAEFEPVVYQEKDVLRFTEIYDERERAFKVLRERKIYIPEPPAETSSGAGIEPLADS